MISSYISAAAMAQQQEAAVMAASRMHRIARSHYDAKKKVESGKAIGMAFMEGVGLWAAVVERSTDVPRTGRARLAP